MSIHRHTAITILLSSLLVALLLYAYISDAWKALLVKHHTEAVQQHALDRLFGSDQPFNPAAENVVMKAQGAKDTVSWNVLSHVKITAENKMVQVNYAPDILAMSQKNITITGYIFPLQASGQQSHFLLSAYPPSCPYCLPGTPTEFIEIMRATPLIDFTYDPITIQGELSVMQDAESIKNGMFYTIETAKIIH